MRRSTLTLRGAKGYNWYETFTKNGAAGFNKNTPPTPFEWAESVARPRAYFDISMSNEHVGRLTFELADDIMPKTVENFKLLCLGQGAKFGGYKGTKFHYLQKGYVLMGGDIENSGGKNTHSAYTSRYINDENFIIPHSSRGLLSMASVGVNTNGSQFYISLSPTRSMNGRCAVFGRLIEGDDVLASFEKIFTFRGQPAAELLISDCGYIPAVPSP